MSDYIKQPYFPRTVNILLNIYAFFIAFPAISIIGINITFYIFSLICFLLYNYHYVIITRDKSNKLFIILFATGFMTTLFHPPLTNEVAILDDLKISIQYLYWIILAMFFRTNFYLINWNAFSKWLFWGLISLIFSFYFIQWDYNSSILNVSLDITRNGFVYNLLCFIPLTYWYIMTSKFKKFKLLVLLLFSTAVLFSNGRAGFILIVIEALLIGSIVLVRLKGVSRFGLMVIISIVFLWQFVGESKVLPAISPVVEKINPRMSNMLLKEGNEGDLTRDKSWLLRKLMIDKSLEIVKEYPIFGIGWFHFGDYHTGLETLNKYERLRGYSHQFLNSLAAHNSYALYLAESGLVGTSLLIIILILIIVPFLRKTLTNSLVINDLALVSVATLALYFYAISSITGACTWMVFGVALGSLRKNRVEDPGCD